MYVLSTLGVASQFMRNPRWLLWKWLSKTVLVQALGCMMAAKPAQGDSCKMRGRGGRGAKNIVSITLLDGTL
jgi:hypothetical protein